MLIYAQVASRAALTIPQGCSTRNSEKKYVLYRVSKKKYCVSAVILSYEYLGR